MCHPRYEITIFENDIVAHKASKNTSVFLIREIKG